MALDVYLKGASITARATSLHLCWASRPALVGRRWDGSSVSEPQWVAGRTACQLKPEWFPFGANLELLGAGQKALEEGGKGAGEASCL